MTNVATVVSTTNPSAEELLARYEIMDKAKLARIVKQFEVDRNGEKGN